MEKVTTAKGSSLLCVIIEIEQLSTAILISEDIKGGES